MSFHESDRGESRGDGGQVHALTIKTAWAHHSGPVAQAGAGKISNKTLRGGPKGGRGRQAPLPSLCIVPGGLQGEVKEEGTRRPQLFQ